MFIILKSSEILQIDATVITGVFILLTISSAQASDQVFNLNKGLAAITLVIILPFALSALSVAQLEMKRLGMDSVSEQFEKKQLRQGIGFMVGGFLYILVALTIYVSLVLFR